MDDTYKISAALDLAEEYYECGSPEWHAFNEGFKLSQDYWMKKHYNCKCEKSFREDGPKAD